MAKIHDLPLLLLPALLRGAVAGYVAALKLCLGLIQSLVESLRVFLWNALNFEPVSSWTVLSHEQYWFERVTCSECSARKMPFIEGFPEKNHRWLSRLGWEDAWIFISSLRQLIKLSMVTRTLQFRGLVMVFFELSFHSAWSVAHLHAVNVAEVLVCSWWRSSKVKAKFRLDSIK